jgi:hypothetical protein
MVFKGRNMNNRDVELMKNKPGVPGPGCSHLISYGHIPPGGTLQSLYGGATFAYTKTGSDPLTMSDGTTTVNIVAGDIAYINFFSNNAPVSFQASGNHNGSYIFKPLNNRSFANVTLVNVDGEYVLEPGLYGAPVEGELVITTTGNLSIQQGNTMVAVNSTSSLAVDPNTFFYNVINDSDSAVFTGVGKIVTFNIV